MASEGTRRSLEIVRGPKRQQILPQHFEEFNQQTTLFPSPKRGLIIFVHFPDVTEEEFRNTLNQAKPRYVFEFRQAPRFDIGSLNRQSAFRLFSEQQANYVDLTSSSRHQNNESCILIEFKSFARNSHLSLDRPMMVLMSKFDSKKHLESEIAEFLSSLTAQTVEVFEVPCFSRK